MITTCTRCGALYEAGSEEEAYEPERFCGGRDCKKWPHVVTARDTFMGFPMEALCTGHMARAQESATGSGEGNAAEPPTETLLDRWDEQDRKARDTEAGREDPVGASGAGGEE